MQELVELMDAELDMICGGASTVSVRQALSFTADRAEGLSFTQEIAVDASIED